MPTSSRVTATARVTATPRAHGPHSEPAAVPGDHQQPPGRPAPDTDLPVPNPGPNRRGPVGRTRLLAAAAIAVLTVAGATVAFTAAARARPATSLATWHAGSPTTPRTGNSGAPPAASPSPSAAGTATTLASGYTIPGTPPRLPWPSSGQAALEVQGLGSLGAAGSTTPVPIASITKVMVAYLVLRDHPLTTTSTGPTLTITPAEAAAYPQEVADKESLIPVSAGEQLTERQALVALLLPSADNIARILARWDGGSIPAFLSAMNATAARLGMHHTHYTDPSGYDDTTVSTATDQVTLAEHAMALPAFRSLVAMPTGTVPLAGTVHNYNTLLGTNGVIGIKTGSTTPAGGCLLFAATHTLAGHTYTIIGAVLGQHGNVMHGLPQALTASRNLIQAADTALHQYTLIKPGQQVATTATGTPIHATKTATVAGWPGLTYHPTLHLTTTATTGTLNLTTETTTVTITITSQ